MKRIAVLVGSLRRESINRKLARVLARLSEDRLEFNILELSDLPLYNEDLWEGLPPAVPRIKKQIEQADAVLFVSPEYNRSFTAVIKNAIDWGTRPYGQNVFSGKPAAVVGTTPGAIGAAVGQNQLKSVLLAANAIVMGQPELYLSWKPEQFDDEDRIVSEATRSFLENWVAHCDQFIERVSGRP
ncbi:NADPH-dependent FMN reductase [Sinorhizobium fredii]|uniref:NADPH-dependent FMN reductase n=1 Tax=Rhizobium fredii TaxID=380 RepID=UPI0004BC804C|nr:NAD(P)H-dependent oxidoreductase [Sinorhizobium fredii]